MKNILSRNRQYYPKATVIILTFVFLTLSVTVLASIFKPLHENSPSVMKIIAPPSSVSPAPFNT